MHNLITFEQMDSDAERFCNPNLIMGFQLVWRGLMHVRLWLKCIYILCLFAFFKQQLQQNLD